MRVAIIGGTFNPIHTGHLRLAEEVREGLGFARVIFIPVCLPPHKDGEGIPPAAERLDMVRLAIEGNPAFEASDIEIKRGGRSYTVETVKALGEDGTGLEPAIVVGADSFNEITTWCEYEKLFTLADFVVVPRPGHAAKKIAEVVPVELARKFCYDAEKEAYVSSYGHSVTYFDTTLMDISSSDIRRRVAAGMSIRYLVPPGVEEYILGKGLYK
ncbi:MAG: nicotinate-nucleotide adenylyltransferase [Thermodesulfobacteriota bacterium]